ncbi:unnamed protein product [Lepeophtheirus salmonis]|uniref:(salmon louse) hypothetical protein n=1 Tax=Lepeophtheirus salmonis TaxID=72036 RepID=A0A7R8CKT5_LEPSM|nr:unnamed protein product [Lepeophtheirus salmonis]CAF2807111.1 unnamed protein product [Lepeophtheirus salmonis]
MLNPNEFTHISHDLCLTVTGEYLSPGDCKNGLCNYSPVTRSPCQCDLQFVRCLRSAKTKVANALGRLFFNIAGLTCYKYEHPVKRCTEFARPQITRFPPWLLSAMHINPSPKRPRCKRYELDKSKPKIWQFFETFYEENNARSEEPRSSQLPLLQKFFLDIFMSLIDPIR